jgi:hypothetical protein
MLPISRAVMAIFYKHSMDAFNLLDLSPGHAAWHPYYKDEAGWTYLKTT